MNPFFLFRFEKVVPQATSETLVVFVASSDFAAEEFDGALQAEIDRNLSSDQILVVVRDSVFDSVVTSFEGSAKIASLTQRLPQYVSISTASFDEFGKEVRRRTLFGSEPLRVEFDDFKTRAMTRIFRKRGGFVESSSAYHFENPSKRHSKRFLRLANILVSGAEISFFAFCVLPYLEAHFRVAYLDTPSLFGLVGAINDHLVALGSARRLAVDNFRSYDGLKPPKYEFSRSEEAVVLISASSSGSLAGQIAKEDSLLSKMVHILFLGKSVGSHVAVCNLALDAESNPEGYLDDEGDYHAGSCPMCAQGSIAIQLQGDQFDIAGPQPEALLIKAVDAPRGLQPLMRRLAGSKVFGVGLGPPRGYQPRQFEINPEALMANPEFGAKLTYVLERSVPAATAAIVSMDKASRSLAEKIASSSGLASSPPIFSREELRAQTRNDSTAPIVIVAAVIESGRSLLDVSRDLRAVYPKASQIYLIGFAKTTSEDKLRSLRTTIVQTSAAQPHEFATVETIVLPPSASRHAWVVEEEVLRLVLNSADFRPLLTTETTAMLSERLTVLSTTSERMLDNLFLGNDKSKPLRLQSGFVFWPPDLPGRQHTQADVFFTIACVLQALRANGMKPGARALRSGRLQHTILDPYNFGRFNDGLIQACLLRSAQPEELNYAADIEASREMARIIRRILEESLQPRGEAAAEFLMAIATNRLVLSKEHHGDVLAPIEGAPPLIRILLSICSHRTK